jgi:hypothetical protein
VRRTLALWVALLPAAAAAGEAMDEHQLSLYVTTAGSAYLSDARTVAGLGGGFGVRDTIGGRYLLQADATFLLGVSSSGELRVSGGIQRSGAWRPALLVGLSALVGQHFSFLTPQHPTPVPGPAVVVALTAAPLRFAAGGAQISLLELGFGVGSDFPGLGLAYRVSPVEIAATF